MHYKKFIIKSYRGITEPIEIDLEKNSLIPLIGINESGKTTILNALLSFDWYNDDLNEKCKHLTDVHNLASLKNSVVEISAIISLEWEDLKGIILTCKEILKDAPDLTSIIRTYIKTKSKYAGELTITRNLQSFQYTIDSNLFPNQVFNHILAKDILLHMPFILYFDDFRDDVPDKIKINANAKNPWLKIMRKLFQFRNSNFEIEDLIDMDERERRSIISATEKHLNATLTKEWQNFNLDENDVLKVSIDFSKEGRNAFLKLNVVEIDSTGNEHFYFIKDRSKGFYWFFNFVMKVEFNPKVVNNMSIFLLDEPGSYLHASAQAKLCTKLKNLAENNIVVYCTHSHYLLNPESIPLNNIRVVTRESENGISISPINSYTGQIGKKSAFQPIVDSLQIKPFMFDYLKGDVLITEGIYDYYSLELFKGNKSINIIPAANAKSIRYFVSIMIAWGVNYHALWDNDDEGRKSLHEAEKFFGPDEAKNRFSLLPLGPNKNSRSKRIIQDLFDGSDITLIKNELGIPKNASFEKCILGLYYSTNKNQIIQKISHKTHNNFSQLLDSIFPKENITIAGK